MNWSLVGLWLFLSNMTALARTLVKGRQWEREGEKKKTLIGRFSTYRPFPNCLQSLFLRHGAHLLTLKWDFIHIQLKFIPNSSYEWLQAVSPYCMRSITNSQSNQIKAWMAYEITLAQFVPAIWTPPSLRKLHGNSTLLCCYDCLRGNFSNNDYSDDGHFSFSDTAVLEKNLHLLLIWRPGY